MMATAGRFSMTGCGVVTYGCRRNTSMRLSGKTTVITGAARGIGRGIAEAFARGGAAVAVCDIDADAAAKTAAEIGARFGIESLAIAVDVRDRVSVLAMAESAMDRFGRIDVLVNNAGISEVIPFLDMEESLWDATLDTNLKGTYLCCQAVLPQMVERRRGRIINVSSQSGKRGSSHYVAYCASKFGIIGLTQSLAQEYAAQGITVNAICPGVAFTDLWRSPAMLNRYAEKRGLCPEEVERHFEKQIPMGRLCTPEDVARVAVFLASDASDYLTGQAINVTGGAEMR